MAHKKVYRYAFTSKKHVSATQLGFLPVKLQQNNLQAILKY